MLTIRRLRARTPAEAQPVAARLALQALASGLEDAAPSGLAPQALLWVRRLRLQVPRAVLCRPSMAGGAWLSAGREQLDTALRRARRPALEPVSDAAEAVLFADAAELLAALALAAARGELDRWWWRGLLGSAWPAWRVAWAQRPEARPGALRLLARGGWRMDALGELVPLSPGGAPGQAKAQASQRPAPRAEAGVLRAHVEPAPMPMPSNQGHRSTEVSQIREAAREPSEAMDTPPATASEMDKPASMPRPQVVPPASAVASVRRSDGVSALPTPRPRAAPAAPTGIAPSPTAPLAAPAMPDKRVEAVQRADAAASPAKPGAMPSVTLQALAPQPLTLPLATPQPLPLLPADEAGSQASTSSPIPPVTTVRVGESRSPAVSRRARAAGETTHDPAPSLIEAQATWPWPVALPSHQAPLLFVVNLLLEEGLYPDFTRPLDPGLPVPLWALLPALARAWRLAPDPLTSALANRAPDWSPPEDFEAWLAVFARKLRRRLCRRLHWRVNHLAPGLTLSEPARVWLSEAEIVAQFPLESHDIAWRLAGLDRDPGWLPSAGCSLRFEFL
jgi:hypothetical protein